MMQAKEAIKNIPGPSKDNPKEKGQGIMVGPKVRIGLLFKTIAQSKMKEIIQPKVLIKPKSKVRLQEIKGR